MKTASASPWPSRAVEPLLGAGSLVRVLEDWCPAFPGFYLYYPSRRQMPAGLRAFIDMARSA